MQGQAFTEYEMNVDASKVWELYSTLELAKLLEERLPLIDKIEVVEGDGGVGTILNLTFAPGIPGISSYKEKFTEIDNENRVKVAKVVEGGYLNLGFTTYLIRIQVIDKGLGKCIIKSAIEYELKENAVAHATDLVTTKPLEDIAKLAEAHLLGPQRSDAQ